MKIYSRNLWRWFGYRAWCNDCDFIATKQNALGLAAQHHDRTGHDVQIEVEGHIHYASDSVNEQLLREKKI